MAKKTKKTNKRELINEVYEHYVDWTEDMDQRMNRENGWNDVIDAYFGRLPDDWPYYSTVVDPRIRTTVLEKKARLTNSKLRGRLVPREGGDVLKAKLNNALLDFQWDSATEGGSMNAKWGEMDQDTRLFASAFALIKWKEVKDDDKILFEGNEFKKIDPRDSGLDPNCSHIRDANWFQHREWANLADLECESDTPGDDKFPGLSELKKKISEDVQDRRDNAYISRIKQLKGIEDRMGEDKSFPVVELVTEYRPDRWITFSPKYKIILRDIENPYNHRSIPVVQLRYYSLSDDPWGESEVECVLPLWRAIQATICGFLDTMNIHMRPPIKILEGQARMETIVWGPEAQWILNTPDAVTEHSGSGEALNYFQTTYSSLVAAFNTAMGDLSQGVSSVDPFNPEKTATEVRASMTQQNARDQENQSRLAEAIQDMMRMWLSNNQQFLFSDPSRHEYILRIVGKDMFSYFKRAGLDEMELSDQVAQQIQKIIEMQNGNVPDSLLNQMVNAGLSPKYPVIENPQEKDAEKLVVKPKMRLNDMGDSAELSLLPADLQGTFDYVPDVKSMAMGASDQLTQARQQAIALLTNNQMVLNLLQQEGYRPNVKEIFTETLEDAGLRDAERFFSEVNSGSTTEGIPSPGETMEQQGLQGVSAPQAPAGQQMAQPPRV